MDHPGVKSLWDRIIRQQKPQPKTTQENDKEIQLKKFTEIDQTSTTSTTSFTRLTDFKDNLKQRMKARRCQIRKEEEEDNQMDEEYHVIAKEDSDDVITTNSKETKTISDDDEDEDEEEDENENDDANETVDSDSNFILNLNDEDEETEDKKSKNKKTSTKTNKLSCYDFDEDDDELPDLTAKKRDKEIPLTNSIPSNQLTKDNVLNCNYNEFNLLSQDDPDRLFLEGTQFLVSNKQRRSLDELTNISFNYETASNHTNTNTNHHTPNTTTTSTNQNSTGKASNKSSDNTLNDEVLFDELAMLCSGQFRQTTQKNKLAETQPETKEKESITNNDLYEADDGDDYDNVMRNKVLFNDEDSSSSLSNNSVPVNKHPIEPESSPEEVIKPIKETKKKTIEDEELDENKEENLEDILGNDENSNDTKAKEKRNEDSEEYEKEGFFEEEAELSGSEEDDENDDGNSEDDKGLIFSGDEDELPSDSELKQQLGKFLLKDQMDEDKRQIRMFKEMYLADGEMHAKESRRKQFRWKNIDETWNKNNNRSSSEEDEDEEEEEEDDSEENKKEKKKKTEEREKKYAKLIANRNWRLNRHEREQFVHQKLKTNGLLSDEETEKNEYDESDDYSDDDENTKMSTLSTVSSSNNQILKKGQQLLKQSLLNKSEQNKRTLNGEINNVNRPITIQPDKPQPGKQEEKVDLFKKFSFLNRDKSYLNRLSNYVNKNFTGNQGQHMSIGNSGGDFTGIVKPMTNKSRANNMIFSTVDNPALLNDPKTNRNKSEEQQQQQKQTNPASNTSSPVVISSMPKRTKYDTCESIFNHIS